MKTITQYLTLSEESLHGFKRCLFALLPYCMKGFLHDFNEAMWPLLLDFMRGFIFLDAAY